MRIHNYLLLPLACVLAGGAQQPLEQPHIQSTLSAYPPPLPPSLPLPLVCQQLDPTITIEEGGQSPFDSLLSSDISLHLLSNLVDFVDLEFAHLTPHALGLDEDQEMHSSHTAEELLKGLKLEGEDIAIKFTREVGDLSIRIAWRLRMTKTEILIRLRPKFEICVGSVDLEIVEKERVRSKYLRIRRRRKVEE
jgi:hypothetical protein